MSSNDLHDLIQTALGAAYTIDRELAGGGMSRVFLARDSTLRRDIVVKVLHPELASSVSVGRFKREIHLAAQLQHPHIVPILSAGEIDGLPYLVMPFVPGRSLRERLDEPLALSLPEGVEILRDVARALAYAHSQGVIHRDIKPDNVLLAHGAATVTDFGVAKAVSESLAEAGTPLTSAGMGIGTPAYMAPEQAAGDPNTDSRADLYAWGATAYEVLAGRKPFEAATAQGLIAAHIATTPEPVNAGRGDIPPALAALVMRCLAKHPADRPQTAGELLRELSAVTPTDAAAARAMGGVVSRQSMTKALVVYLFAFVVAAGAARGAVALIGLPDWVFVGTLIVMAFGLPVVLLTALVNEGRLTRARRHLSWRRTVVGGALAMAAFIALVVGYMALRALGIGPAGSLFAKGVMRQSDLVLVTDFGAPASDSSLGGVVSEGVREGLSQSRSVRVVQSTAVAAALQRMERSAASRIDLPLAKEIAEREGIKAIVDGNIAAVGRSGTYIITTRLLSARGDALASVQESAATANDIIPAIDRTVRDLRTRVGESLKEVRDAPALEQATTASLPALRSFSEGVRLNARERNYPAAIAALEEAIRQDSTFAGAYRDLAVVYTNARLRPARADSLRVRAFQLRNRLPPLERALVEQRYYQRGPHADRGRQAAAGLEALKLDPDSPQALNDLAMLLATRREYAAAETLLKRDARVQPGIQFGWSNMMLPLVSEGKLEEAMRVFDDFRHRFPQIAQPMIGPGAVWYLRGKDDSTAVLCRQATAAPLPQTQAEGYSCVAALALLHGRLREHLDLASRGFAIERARGAPGISLQAALDSALVDVWFRERPADALRRLDALVTSDAMRNEGLLNYRFDFSPYFVVAELYADAGRPDRARAVLSQYDTRVADTARFRLDRALRHRATGEIAIAEKQYDVAIRELAAADTMYDGFPIACGTCIAPRLAQAYDLAGKQDQAIAAFEQFLNTPYYTRVLESDPQFRAGAYKRLGELYEAKGNRAQAMSNYSKFVELWKGADSELQPKVEEVKRRMTRLSRSSS